MRGYVVIMAAGSTFCRAFIYIHQATGVYLVESVTECGVLLSYLEAVTCAEGGLDTLVKHFMDTNYSCPVKSTD